MKKENLKNAVIEINEVEYLINEKSINALEDGKKLVPIKRLIDGKEEIVSIDTLNEAIQKNGIIDHLE